MTKIDNRTAAEYIAKRVPFESWTGNLSGTSGCGSSYGWLRASEVLVHGRGPTRTRNLTGRLNDPLAPGRADFVVWSYWTPIAWHLPDGRWIESAQRFSPTTSKHQHTARMGIAGHFWDSVLTADGKPRANGRSRRVA